MKKQLLNVFAITVIAFTTQAQTVPDYVPTNGLVGYWGFDGDANDYSGNNIHGSVNGASLTEDRFGESNSAYLFDGVDDVITLTQNSLLDFGAFQDFSFSGWFNTNTAKNNGIYGRFNGGGATGTYHYGRIAITDVVHRIQPGSSSLAKDCFGSQSIDLNTWYHVVFVIKRNGNAQVYINGLLSGESDISEIESYNISDTSIPIYFGNIGTQINYFFSGMLDDIGIWDRALTQCEITALYEAQQPACATSCIVAQYDFSGDAKDLSGNGNHGTVNGATLAEDRFGNPNSAYSFDGVDDYIRLTHSNSFNFSTIPFTINLWINTTSNISGGRSIFTKERVTAPDGHQFRLGLDNSSTATSDYYYFHGGSNFNSTHWNNTDGYTLSNRESYLQNQWSLLSITREDKYYKLYQDGVLKSIDSTLLDVVCDYSSNTLDIIIGARLDVAGTGTLNYFLGLIDDIKIYNCALSAEQIDSIFQAEKPCTSYLQQDTITYQVSDAMFNVVGEAVYLDSVITQNYPLGCDSVYEFYSKFVFNATHCTDTVEVLDTIYISVHDTLIIDAVLTGLIAPNNTNTIKVYPNPTSTHIFIDNGDYAKMNGYTIRIDNSLGQTIFNEQITQQQFYVNLSEWTGNGLYFMHIIDNLNNIIETRKIVLQ
jgi:hypothetical protein